MSKQSVYPFPVYVATFADNTVGRISFATPQGKPYDFARGRRVAALLYGRPDGAPWCKVLPYDVTATERVGWTCNGCHKEFDSFFVRRNIGGHRTGSECPHCGTDESECTERMGEVTRQQYNIVPLVYAPRDVIDGYVEHDMPGQPFVRVRDPHFAAPGATVAKAPRIVWKAIAEQARQALESGNAAGALQILQAAA
jgi:hypothetical protein